MNKEEIEKLKLELLGDDEKKSSNAWDEFFIICYNHLNHVHGIADMFNYSYGNYTYFLGMGELECVDFDKTHLKFYYSYEDEFVGSHESTIKIKYVDLIDFDYETLFNKYKNKRINSYTNKIRLLNESLSYYGDELLKYQHYEY